MRKALSLKMCFLHFLGEWKNISNKLNIPKLSRLFIDLHMKFDVNNTYNFRVMLKKNRVSKSILSKWEE